MILITLLFSINYVCLFLIIRRIIDMHKSLNNLEKKINYIQYQIDDILCDINIVNENVINRTKDEITKDEIINE